MVIHVLDIKKINFIKNSKTNFESVELDDERIISLLKPGLIKIIKENFDSEDLFRGEVLSTFTLSQLLVYLDYKTTDNFERDIIKLLLTKEKTIVKLESKNQKLQNELEENYSNLIAKLENDISSLENEIEELKDENEKQDKIFSIKTLEDQLKIELISEKFSQYSYSQLVDIFK